MTEVHRSLLLLAPRYLELYFSFYDADKLSFHSFIFPYPSPLLFLLCVSVSPLQVYRLEFGQRQATGMLCQQPCAPRARRERHDHECAVWVWGPHLQSDSGSFFSVDGKKKWRLCAQTHLSAREDDLGRKPTGVGALCAQPASAVWADASDVTAQITPSSIWPELDGPQTPCGLDWYGQSTRFGLFTFDNAHISRKSCHGPATKA